MQEPLEVYRDKDGCVRIVAECAGHPSREELWSYHLETSPGRDRMRVPQWRDAEPEELDGSLMQIAGTLARRVKELEAKLEKFGEE